MVIFLIKVNIIVKFISKNIIISGFMILNLIFFLIFFSGTVYSGYNAKKSLLAEAPEVFLKGKIIKKIIIDGLKNVSIKALEKKIPFREGSFFEAKVSSYAIKNLYSLGCFSEISIFYEENSDETVNVYIKVKEKYKVSNIQVKNNHHLSIDAIEKKLFFTKIFWIDNASALVICKKIEKLYNEKNYINAKVIFEFIPTEEGFVDVFFNVDEGEYGRIQKINFSGNSQISRHLLKENIAGKEYWILGFFDGSGNFRKEIINYDRYQIENFYQNNGFFEAHVLNAIISGKKNGFLDITYDIYEGPLYKFRNVNLKDAVDMDYVVFRDLIDLDSYSIYSKEKIKNSINNIRNKLGEMGYMYPTISPKMIVDRDNHFIDLDFIIEKGKPIFVRNINIRGNNKTEENVIRREILFSEGELITTRKLEDTKRAIETLGYFAPYTGVSWNMNMVDVFQADLDLILSEVKTGKFYFNLGINNGSDSQKNYSDPASISWYNSIFDSTKIGVTLQNSNFSGKGIRYFLNGSYANLDRSLSCGMSTNWIYDLPINAGWNLSFRGIKYEDFRQSNNIPSEKDKSANVQFGFRAHQLNMILFGLSSGIDVISYTQPVVPKIQFPEDPSLQMAFSEIVTRSFQPGTVTWATFSISDDKRNHPFRPTSGYQWIIDCKYAFPGITEIGIPAFSFIKTGLDFRWYTPLIVKYNTVLHIHGYAGIVSQLFDNNVPYKELFHVGGAQSVRGFQFGQIGPTLLGSSLGGSKAFFVNCEIQCPINKNGTMMGRLFYDGGAAWDTIFNSQNNLSNQQDNFIYDIFDYISPQMLIQNNNMKYRHSVGFGISLTAPMPITIDWAFKLDRNKKLGEKLSEVHISMEGSY
jgi:outer membrane protein insertion porin family